jgi:hypothetical protein
VVTKETNYKHKGEHTIRNGGNKEENLMKNYGKIRKIKYMTSTRSLPRTFYYKKSIEFLGIINKLVKDNEVCKYLYEINK